MIFVTVIGRQSRSLTIDRIPIPEGPQIAVLAWPVVNVPRRNLVGFAPVSRLCTISSSGRLKTGAVAIKKFRLSVDSPANPMARRLG